MNESCPEALTQLVSTNEFAVVEDLLAALAPAPATEATAATSLEAQATSEDATRPSDEPLVATVAELVPDVAPAPASANTSVDSFDVVLSLEEGTSGDARAEASVARDVDPVA